MPNDSLLSVSLAGVATMSKRRRYVEFAKSGDAPPETPTRVVPEAKPEIAARTYREVFERLPPPPSAFFNKPPYVPFAPLPRPTYQPDFDPRIEPLVKSDPRLKERYVAWGADLLNDDPPAAILPEAASSYDSAVLFVKEKFTPPSFTGPTRGRGHDAFLYARVEAILNLDEKALKLEPWEQIILEDYIADCDAYDEDIPIRQEILIKKICDDCV